MSAYLLQSVAQLVQEEAYESALAVCGFINSRDEDRSRASLVLESDALAGLDEFERAIARLQSALSLFGGSGGGSSSDSAVLGVDISQPSIRYKIAKYLHKLGRPAEAISQLQYIEQSQRPLRALLLLARLKKQSGSESHAKVAFRAAFEQNPLALEAVSRLSELGYPVSSSKRTSGGAKKMAGQLVAKVPWFGPYLSVFKGLATKDFALVNVAFDQLLSAYPANCQLLQHAAQARYDMGDPSGAKLCFDQAFELDKQLVTGMDTYARLLVDATAMELTPDEARGGGRYEPARRLNALAHNGLPLVRTHPEVLNIMALVHLTHGLKAAAEAEDEETKNEILSSATGFIRAGEYIQRSNALCPSRVRTLEIQSYIHEQRGEHALAMKSIKQAVSQAGPHAAPGLMQNFVRIACDNMEHRATLRRALLLVKNFPGVSAAYVVLASVYLEQRMLAEARGAVVKAQQLRPSDPEAVVLHAKILVEMHDHSSASHELSQFITKYGPTAAVLHLLGECHYHQRQPESAQACWLQAMELTERNPSHPLTAKIEKLLKTIEGNEGAADE